MDWEKALCREGKNTELPETWLFLHYYEALNILFRIENALRIFVFVILKNELQEKWSELSVTSDDNESSTILAIAKKRINQAKSFGYSITCPMMHLTSGELIRLITASQYWKYFNGYFLADKGIIENKLAEIGSIRNSLAHFRPIREDDVDLIKQISKHVLIPIEKCITEMIECKNIVPTNTSEEWYRELKTLGTDNCTLSFSQSNEEEWVTMNLQYNCPIILKKQFGGGFVRYRVLNVKSSAILKEFPDLVKFITFLSEDMNYPEMNKDLVADFSKDLKFVFSRKILQARHKEIKVLIEKMLLIMSEETQFIKEDNLAKGKIVYAVITFAEYKKSEQYNYWNFNTRNFSCAVSENDPPEYWGDFDVYTRNFISNTHKYPWMPIEVSAIKSPF